MELNLFCFIICSLNILTLTTNFVYSCALSIDKEVKQANSTVKWNIKVKVPKDERIATSDDKDTDKFSGVPLSILAQLPEIDPCIMPSNECPPDHWPWCEVVNGTVRCICILEHYRSPPICKPTCTFSDSECDGDMWCIYSQCRHPCPGYCSPYTWRDLIKHTPQCSMTCPPGLACTPDFSCHHMHQEPIPISTTCTPNPCGLYSQCREDNEDNEIAVCKCLPNSVGSPPNCIRKCTNNFECNELRACINNRCSEICPACGNDAQCEVYNHTPYCSCLSESLVRNDSDVNCQIIHEAMDPTFGYKQYPIMSPKFDPTRPSMFDFKTERDFLEWKKKNRWPYTIPPPPKQDHYGQLSSFNAGDCPSDTSRLNGKCIRIDE